jgi:pectate lyase
MIQVRLLCGDSNFRGGTNAMRLLLLSVSIACLTANALLATPAIDHIDLGRETLATNDGWASFSTGTTGGASAADNQVYTVHNRRELIAALNNGVYPPPSSTPSSVAKIIYVDGV